MKSVLLSIVLGAVAMVSATGCVAPPAEESASVTDALTEPADEDAADSECVRDTALAKLKAPSPASLGVVELDAPSKEVELFPTARADRSIKVYEGKFDATGFPTKVRPISGWCYDTAKDTVRFDRAVKVTVVLVEYAANGGPSLPSFPPARPPSR